MSDQPERCEAWDSNKYRWLLVREDSDLICLYQPYNMENHVAGGRIVPINFCPWCGAALPDERHQ